MEPMGFDPCDETINFGTRGMVDGDTLHQATTIAVLQCTKLQKSSNININCRNNGDFIFCAINFQLAVFKNEEIFFDQVFNENIATLSVASNAQFFLVALKNGDAQLFQCEESEIKSINNFEVKNVVFSAFLHNKNDVYTFVIVTSVGKLFLYSYNSQTSQASLDLEFDFKFAIENVACNSASVLFVNGSKMALYNLRNGKHIIDDFCLKLNAVTACETTFLAIESESESLVQICSSTLFVFMQENIDGIKFKQIVVAECCAGYANQLYVVIEESNENKLQQRTYPDMSVNYTLPLSEDVYLIQPENVNHEINFVSIKVENDLIQRIRLLLMTETDPLIRLQKLLRRQRFDDAKRFATNFKLDPILIIKAKASILYEKSICSSEDVDQLLSYLKQIQEDEFLVEAIQNVEMSCTNLDDVKKVLTFGCNLKLNTRCNNYKQLEACQLKMISTLYKLQTFYAIYENDHSIDKWNSFLQRNLIDELKERIESREIEQACILYTRLDDETIRNNIDVHVIDELLYKIQSNNIDSFKPFLAIFIPHTLKICSNVFSAIIKWVFDQVAYFEHQQHELSNNYPQNAIEFVTYTIDLISNQNFLLQVKSSQTSLDDLLSILQAMKHVETLKLKYRIKILVSDFLKGPKHVVKALLKKPLSSGEFDALINGFLLLYIQENLTVTADQLFVEEIKNRICYQEVSWIAVVSSMLNCISCVQMTLTAIKQVLLMAAVPWSANIKNISMQALKYSGAIVDEIKEMIIDEPMQTVLKKPVYDFNGEMPKNLHQFVYRIIYCNDDDMVNDCFNLTSGKLSKYRNEVVVMLINSFIDKGKFDEALNLLDAKLSPAEAYHCYMELLYTIENRLNHSKVLKNANLKFYLIFFQRLINLTENPYKKEELKNRFELLQNVEKLRAMLNIEVTLNVLVNNVNKSQLISDFIDEYCLQYSLNEIKLNDLMHRAKLFASLLSINQNEFLIRICKECKDFQMIYNVAEIILNSLESDPKILCRIIVLIFKYVGTFSYNFQTTPLMDATFVFVDKSADSTEENDEVVFYKGLKLAQQLAAHAGSVEMQDKKCMAVYLWIYATKLFTNNEDLKDAVSNLSLIRMIQELFECFSSFVANFNAAEFEYLIDFNENLIDCTQFIAEIKQLVHKCKFDKIHQFTCYSIIKTMKDLLAGIEQAKDISKQLDQFLNKELKTKLQHLILLEKNLNTTDLYKLLLESSSNDAREFILGEIAKHRHYPDKLDLLIKTARKLISCQHFECTEEIKTDLNGKSLSIKWWKMFEHCSKMNFNLFVEMPKMKKFYFLIEIECMEIEKIAEFSRDFHLDLERLYIEYFKRLITVWKPNYEVHSDLIGTKYIVVKNDYTILSKKCEQLVKFIDSTYLIKLIDEMWTFVNFYYYEIFFTLLSILEKIHPNYEKLGRKESMLMFLQNYRRIAKPTETEIEQWFSIFPDKQNLDELSNYRLPFTPTLFSSKIFDIIRPEINLKTYYIWFDAALILDDCLTANEICSYAVKELVTSGALSRSPTSEEWQLTSKLNDVLAEVDRCIENISCKKLAISVINHLMNNIPPGADKVNAACILYKYGVRYNESDDKAHETFVKIEKKYCALNALHILHQWNLADEVYIDLIGQPNSLIVGLYGDERILRKIDENDMSCPNITRAVEMLANFFHFGIKEIRLKLIEQLILHENDASIENDLKRASYICFNDDIAFFRHYLITLKNDVKNKSLISRVNALKLFAMITKPSEIEEKTGLSFTEFQNDINKLYILHYLDLLRMSTNEQQLEEMHKKQLLNRLILIKSEISIKTIALILMTYRIESESYWRVVLQGAVKYSMFTDLQIYLDFMKGTKFGFSEFYCKAWQILIDHFFQSFVNGPDLRKKIVKTFLLLQLCPVLYFLNFESVFAKLMHLGMGEFAALLLQYVEKSRRADFLKMIKDTNIDREVLKELGKSGICGVGTVVKILENEV